MIVIGTMLMLTVPLRYLIKHAMSLDDRGLLIGGFGYGPRSAAQSVRA